MLDIVLTTALTVTSADSAQSDLLGTLPLGQGRQAYVTQSRFQSVRLTHLFAEDTSGALEHLATWSETHWIKAFYAFDVNRDGFAEILMESRDDDFFDHVLFGLNRRPMAFLPGGGWQEILEIQPADTWLGGIYLDTSDRDATALITQGFDSGLGQPDHVRCLVWGRGVPVNQVQWSTDCPPLPEQTIAETQSRILVAQD